LGRRGRLHAGLGEESPCGPGARKSATEHGVGRVGVEASGGYEVAVIDALATHGLELVRFNARRIRLFAQARGRLAKNDRADAAIIAQATAVLVEAVPPAPQRQLAPLIELLNYRRRLIMAT